MVCARYPPHTGYYPGAVPAANLIIKEGPFRMKTALRRRGIPLTPRYRVIAFTACVCALGAGLRAPAYGSEWANLSAGSEEKGLRAVAIDPMNPQRVFIGSTKGVFTSGDGGKVWVNCLDLSASRRLVPADLGPAQKALVEGLLAAGDSGEIAGATALAIDPANQQKIVAGSVDGIYASTDGGKNWMKANGVLKDKPVTVLGLAIDLSNPEMVYAATLDRALLKSGDGGKTWIQVELPGGEKTAASVAVHPFDSNLLYVGTPDAVLKTKKGGAAWEKLAAQPKIAESIAIDPVNPDAVYVGTSSGLYKTADGGASWKELGADALGRKQVRKVAVSPSDSNAVYAVGAAGIYGSSDAGVKWRELSKGMSLANAMAIAFDPLDSGTIWAAASGGLYRTAVAKGSGEAAASPVVAAAAPLTGGAPEESAPKAAEQKPEEPKAEQKAEEIVPAQTAPSEEQVAAVSVEEPPAAKDAGKAAEGAAPAGPAIPTIDDVQTVLGQFSHEPTVQEIQEVAMRFAEVHPDIIEGWRKGAKYKALLPKFKITYDYNKQKASGEKNGIGKEITREDNTNTSIEDKTVDSSDGGITITEIVGESGENNYKVVTGSSSEYADARKFENNYTFSFEWDFGDFLFNPDQVRISDESRDLVELRNDVLEEVTQFYFQRRQLQIDLLLSPAEELRERLRLELQLQEVTANIDYLTGGYLTQRLNDVKAGKTGKPNVVKRLFSI
jgi:photosystem II stability/assembly factor-like uncharacterized protein